MLIFGEGSRQLHIFTSGRLIEAATGREVDGWDVLAESLDADGRGLSLVTRAGRVRLYEDEEALWREADGHREALTQGPVNWPDFSQHPHGLLLSRLLHETLVNIDKGQPLPNALVYTRPWMRDAAMVSMVLQRTGNLGLIRDWVLGLADPFDRNNAGIEEPDNLGQVLYLLSHFAGAEHSLVPQILATTERFREGDHLTGQTDFGEHPVYQTQWFKWGLRALNIDDPFIIPVKEDSYAGLFWMDFREHYRGPEVGRYQGTADYPYLGWAEAHTLQLTPPWSLLGDRESTKMALTWESKASQADYAALKPYAPQDAEERISRPHSWHAAEAFLYLLERND